jgi:hypothetical protein
VISHAQADTGSANLAVAGSASTTTPYFEADASSTFQMIGTSVSVSYTVGSWSGVEVSDVVLLVNSGTESLQTNFALMQTANNFFGETTVPFQVFSSRLAIHFC